jgi:ATP-dependent helicase/nuclease subunit B
VELLGPNAPPHSSDRTPAEVFACIGRGGAIVAANARSARALRRSYDETQRKAGKAAWPTPPIYDRENWFASLWRQHLLRADNAPMLLSELQERAVWKRVVGTAPESLAGLASEAWALLSDFAAHVERRHSWSGFATADAEAFRGWAADFERECRRNQWIARADLPELLAGAIRRSVIELPAELLLIGFDRITPSLQAILDAARAANCGVTILRPEDAAYPPQLVQATDLRNEIETCAWWARRQLEANPGASIAIILQDIDGVRGEIDRTFRRVLTPQSPESSQSVPFEFSLGQPLAETPVIQAALLLLRWLAGPLDQMEVSWLTISGFFSAPGEDLAEMAALDAEIRRRANLPPEIPLEAFAPYRPRGDSSSARRFLGRLRDLHGAAESVARRPRSFPEWLDFAESALRQARWPGGRALDSLEFQALGRWERLSGDLAGLGFDGSRVGYSEFVGTLTRRAEETIFAPESRGASIQIMGAFESAGQSFDAIWFLGADDRQWPPSGRPNPLLPPALRRKAGMPHSSADLDWEIALTATRRMIASAPACIFSHSRRDDSGELRPSPLLREAAAAPLATTPSQDLQAKLNVPAQSEHRCQTVFVEDASAIPWPKDLPAGGTEILRRQSACPFQAFAVRRLGAAELDSAERGLTPGERGNILHKVMEALWSSDNPDHLRLQTRDDLFNAKAAGRLAPILGHHIQRVFSERAGAAKQSDWSREYLGIEQIRLHSLLSQWLDYEAGREPFSVDEQEKETSAEINGLRLRLRVDRIDRVAGGRLILDYKTGVVSPAMWDGPRPDDPQLPLYGVYGPVDDLRGILFAQIRAGEMCFAGRAEDATATIAKTLSAQSRLTKEPLDEDALGDWADALSNLADGFLAGDAAVAPKSYPKTCQHCALPALCRVAESSIAVEAEEDESEAGHD